MTLIKTKSPIYYDKMIIDIVKLQSSLTVQSKLVGLGVDTKIASKKPPHHPPPTT